MKKNGLKNFIFSFLISLLAVVVVNKGVFHTPNTQNTNKKANKIEAKQISLFAKKDTNVKKKQIDISGIEKLTVAQNVVNDAANDSIPQIDIVPEKVQPEKPQIIYQPTVTVAKNNIIVKEPKAQNLHNGNIELASATEIVLEKEIKATDTFANKPDFTQIAFADISDTITDEENLNKTQAQIVYKPETTQVADQPLTIAQNNTAQISEIEFEQEEIPLIASNDILHENIDVMTSAENTQIAMLEPNTLISTIDEQEHIVVEEEKSISEVNLKQENVIKNSWTQMSDASSSDSPWVVAKGNRFAKNKIAQFDALEEERQKAQKSEPAETETIAQTDVVEQNQNVVYEPSEQTEFTTEPVAEIQIAGNENAAVSDTPAETTQNNIIVHQKTSEIEATQDITVVSDIISTSSKQALDLIKDSYYQSDDITYDDEETYSIDVSLNNAIAESITNSISSEEIALDDTNASISLNDIISEEAHSIDISLNDEVSTETPAEETYTTSLEDITSEQMSDIAKLAKETSLAPKPLLVPSNGTKVARQMMQNLIIPIPEDIMNDADAIPMLSADPGTPKKDTPELKKEEKESGLFKSITSWFSSDDKNKEKDASKKENKEGKSAKNKKKKKSFSLFESKKEPELESNNSADEYEENAPIMPAELKLSFQPNRAEISGHTLKWIHAFADNARDNHGIYIEIRIDGTNSFTLQQKRLNLLSTIFANRGVDFRKVNIVFTSREPNSFIIRNIKFNNSEEMIINQDENPAYQRW